MSAACPTSSVGMSSRVLLLAVLLLPLVSASVIKDLHGPQRSEVLYASSGGGTHVYISGTDIGSERHLHARAEPRSAATLEDALLHKGAPLEAVTLDRHEPLL